MNNKPESTLPALHTTERLFNLKGKLAVIVGGGKMGAQFGATLSSAGAKTFCRKNSQSLISPTHPWLP